MNARVAALLLCCAIALVARPAQARVERYAVVIGNNHGDGLPGGDGPLRYAESDAARMYEVLRELGDFQPVNMVLLRDEPADLARSTLIAINQRIRAAISLPDTQVMLFVYYSGHADEDALHLRDTRFPIGELAQLVSGSAASFRLLVLDACRSGALTRVKGGRIRPAFALPEERLPGDGLAFLTASSANEDAQESDLLRGSFFTQALISGLLGAADADGDGAVVLNEAYRHAYESTLRATSRTAAGMQHPTFRYDFRGQGELVLTRPLAFAAQRATLRFPQGVGFLLLREHAEGGVVAELGAHSGARALSVRAGRYFVRGRGRDVLYEGAVDATAGETAEVALDQLQRIEYARLVRKGGASAQSAQGLELGGALRSALPNADTPCFGGFAGYRLDLAQLGLVWRLSTCTAQIDNAVLSATIQALDLDMRAYRAWDFARLALSLGAGAGASLFVQRFETRGAAPTRNTLAPFVALAAGADYDVAAGWYVALDLAAETHFLPLERKPGGGERGPVSFALRTHLAAGKRF